MPSAPAPQQSATSGQKDLPSISLAGKDAFEKFELSLPFCRTTIKNFAENVAKAHEACGGEGYVTIDSLCKVFTTPAWAQLTQNDSKLVKVLLSDAFKDKSKHHGPDQICETYLMCYGLILCAGKPVEKCEVFFGILQDGGIAKHTFIAAEDADLPDVFRKICLLATVHLFEWAHEFTGTENPFEDDVDKLERVHEDLRENKFLDDVFGDDSKLDTQPWIDAMCKKAVWLYNAKDVRMEVFKAAGVTYQV
jgi:hypothetical protein